MKSDGVSHPTVFSFSVVLTVLGPLHFVVNFRIRLSISVKKTHVEILTGNALIL